MPIALVGLPGARISIVPVVGDVQTSVTSARVVSPAIFLAIAGRPAVFCTWSITTPAGAVGPRA